MNISELLKTEIGSYEPSTWRGKIGGQEVTLEAKPITPVDIQAITRKYPDFTTKPTPEAMAYAISLKAVDENGNRVITPKDFPIFARLDVRKIGEIFGALFSDQFEELSEDGLEEMEKN